MAAPSVASRPGTTALTETGGNKFSRIAVTPLFCPFASLFVNVHARSLMFAFAEKHRGFRTNADNREQHETG